MSGKGSRPRPYSVSQEQFGANFDAIFRKPNPQPEEDKKADAGKEHTEQEQNTGGIAQLGEQ